MANFSRFELTFIFLTVGGVCLLVESVLNIEMQEKTRKVYLRF